MAVKDTKQMPKAVLDLMDEVDALCRVYIGKDAPGEQWRDTLFRFDRIAKSAKRARAAVAKADA